MLYRFGRERQVWPDATQMRLAVTQLQQERDAYLAELNALIATRRAEKRSGKRQNLNPRLTEMLRRKGNHQVPRVGYWGWRQQRENSCR